MKRLFLFLSCFSIAAIGFSQIGGTLDPSFGNAGKVIKSVNPGADKAYAVTLLSDSSFLVGGTTYNSVSGNDFFCVKFLTDGAIDTSFGTNGVISTDLQVGSDDMAFSLAAYPNGNFVLAGYSNDGITQYAAMVGYLPDGSIDTSFGFNGLVLMDYLVDTTSDQIKKIRIHALTGKIVAVGIADFGGSNTIPMGARFLSNGEPDTTFDGNGIKILAISSADYSSYFEMNDLQVEPSGRITFAGSRYSLTWIARYNSNGSVDNTFGSNGSSTPGSLYYCSAMYRDASTGNVYIAGSVTEYFGYSDRHERITIKRVTASGGADNWAYAGQNPYHYLSNYNWECYANALAVTPDGYFYMAGTSYTTNNRHAVLLKATPDGGADYTFTVNGSDAMVEESFGAAQCEAFDVVVQPDEKVVIVGYAGNDLLIARYYGKTVAQLDSFNLISLANNSSGTNCNEVDLEWSDAPGALGYELEIDTNINFPNNDPFDVYDSYIHYDELDWLDIATTYYWRVRSWDNNNYSSIKGPWKFTTMLDNIALVSPANNATGVNTTSVLYDWSDITPASVASYDDGYDFQLADNPGFVYPYYTTMDASPSSFNTTSQLLPGETYYWRVRSKRTNSKKGPWSATSQFTTAGVTGVEGASLPEVSVFLAPGTSRLEIKGIDARDIQSLRITGMIGASQPIAIANIIDISHLASGIYLMHLSAEKGQAVMRFVKE